MIQPKNDRLLVRMLPDTRSTLIETPKDTESRLIKGEVLAVGPKVKSSVCVGECVLFTQACRELKAHKCLPADELLIQDGDLAGIVEREARVTDGRNTEM
jgi:co-chaperonin GroES (HSP10)